MKLRAIEAVRAEYILRSRFFDYHSRFVNVSYF